MGLILILAGLACAGPPTAPPPSAAATPAATPAPPPAVTSGAESDGARVVAVSMNGSGAVPPACRLPFEADGQPCGDAAAPVPLTAVQASVLRAVLADPSTWGGSEGKCSLPLHGFAWRAADGAIQAQVAVSLLCDKVEGAPAVPGQPSEPGERGLSEAGVLSLRALCVDVGLPHCHITQPGEAFGR